MSYPEAVTVIQNYVLGNWSATPVKYPDVPFIEPPTAPYVALTMVENSIGGVITAGAVETTQLYRMYGFITAQIFGQTGKRGEIPTLTLAHQWVLLFGRGLKTFAVSATERLECVAANIITIGENNGRYQVNVLTEYLRDEFATGG